MTLKNINEEISVIKAHLDQDKPDVDFIVRHAESLLLMAHELAADRTFCSGFHDESFQYRSPGHAW